MVPNQIEKEILIAAPIDDVWRVLIELAIFANQCFMFGLGQNAPYIVDGRRDEDLLLYLIRDHFAE